MIVLNTGCAQNTSPEYLAKASPEDRTLALLKSPKIDDLYAARVDYFSDYEYGTGGAAFGVLKIIQVTPEQLMFYSSLAANVDRSMALLLLQKNISEIDWDTDELITILRSDLLPLFDKGMIIEAMRPGIKLK